MSLLSPRTQLPAVCRFLLPSLVIATSVCWLFAGAAVAQPSTPAEPKLLFEADTAVSWVLVPTLVTRRGGAVSHLGKSDFLLRVDGREVAIDSFDTEEEIPLTVLFFQDLSGSMANGGKLEASREVLSCLIERARADDSMALVTFGSGSLMVDVPLTRELSVLAESSVGWEAYGQTALHDAVTWIPEIRLGASRRPAAVLITDGIDNASVLDAETARQMVRQAEIPVYVLALRGSRVASPGGPARRTGQPGGSPLPHAARADEFMPYGRVLRRLAESTGGRYFEVWGRDDLDKTCITIQKELRGRYTLGFPIQSGGEEAFHSLQITLPKRHLTVRHRAGYFGPQPP